MGTSTNVTNLNPDEIVDRLIANLAECNKLVSILGQQTPLDPADLRKIKNNLMFTRTKARNLARSLEDMKKPVNAFRVSS